MASIVVAGVGADRMTRSGRVPNGPETTGLKLLYLQGTELFQDFTPEQLESFHHTIQMATCAAGHVFYRPGESSEAMFLLKQGAAQLYRVSPEGRKFVFADVPAGSVFGEMACVGQAMYECFAEATADSVICTLNRADVQRLMLTYPRFAMRLIESISRRLIAAERQLEDFAFKAVVPRLAALLQREARDGSVDGLSHQDIGDRLGVYRETATYGLNALKAAGIIDIGRRRIRIRDEAQLGAIARGE